MRAFVSLEWVLLKVHAVEKLQASLLHAVWQKTVAQLTCLHLFSHGKEMVSETDFFGLKQWLCVPLTDTQSVLVAGWARVYSSPTKGHVVPQILQPLQGKCVSWLNQQHQAQMIAPPEGWRLIDWFFFFSFHRGSNSSRWIQSEHRLFLPWKWLTTAAAFKCQKAHIIFSNDAARLTDPNGVHVQTATGEDNYHLFPMELSLDFFRSIYIYKNVYLFLRQMWCKKRL